MNRLDEMIPNRLRTVEPRRSLQLMAIRCPIVENLWSECEQFRGTGFQPVILAVGHDRLEAYPTSDDPVPEIGFMSDPTTPAPEDRPGSQRERIDRACDRFETETREGRPPRIEEFVGLFPDINRQALVEELIALEVELRGTKDETVTFDVRHQRFSFEGYYQRFPEATPILDALQNEWDQCLANLPELEFPVVGPDSQADADVQAAPRRSIKQFELKKILGQGGFGIVWRAEDKRLQRDVALKLPRPHAQAFADTAMFLREARAAAKLRHPNIVAIYEVGEHDSQIYIVSELVDGLSLKAWTRTQKLSPVESAGLIAKLATAVQHAHDQGIIHRDLKPANILIDKQNEPHIADFGMAKRDTGEGSQSVDDGLMGTPAYMAPEQARGQQAAIDARTDVYALGAIFYELLTDERPFQGDTAVLLDQAKNATPKSPRLIKPEIPQDLEAICLKCLAKESAHRYPTAHALAEDIHHFLAGESLRGIPAAMPQRVGKWFQRQRRFVIAIVLTFCIALCAAGGLAWQLRDTPQIPKDWRKVQFTTQPAGCEITLVPLDPQTGEPDPTRIQHATGRTPLTMVVPPSDYLVVAVLDDTRFHEVYRHVPPPEDTISFAHHHLRWRLDSTGTITVPEIKIPDAVGLSEMTLIETSKLLEEPAGGKGSARTWRLPSFYIDRREMTVQEFDRSGLQRHGAEKLAELRKSKHAPDPGPGPLALLSGFDAIQRQELAGKRLPSAAELYYLSSVVCHRPPAGANIDPAAPCALPDQSQIEGVHSGVWEWTTTKPGGPFSRLSKLAKIGTMDILLKMIGCGSPMEQPFLTATGFKTALDPQTTLAGPRGVRSLKPRRRPEDFLVPVSEQSF